LRPAAQSNNILSSIPLLLTNIGLQRSFLGLNEIQGYFLGGTKDKTLFVNVKGTTDE
jgi:hypothetical protein